MDPYPNLSERLNDEEITAAYDGKASTETLEERSEQELHTSDAKATEKNALRNHIMNQFSEHLQGKKVIIFFLFSILEDISLMNLCGLDDIAK